MTNQMPIKAETSASAPDNYKKIKCTTCGSEWYVPEGSVPEDCGFVCPECSKAQIDSVNESKAAAENALKG